MSSVEEESERLYYAIISNNTSSVKQILDNGILKVNTLFHGLSGNIWHGLHLCVEKGHIEMAKLLIDYGADLEYRTKWKETPLMCAVIMEWEDMVRLFIDHGADINATHIHGKTPLHLSVSCSSMVSLDLLIENKCDVDARDMLQRTPLWVAVSKEGHIPAVKRLIAAGCNVNVADASGNLLPIQAAIMHGGKDTMQYVQLLLAEGCVLDNTHCNSHSTLMTVLFRNWEQKDRFDPFDMELFTTILKGGCSVNCVTVRGYRRYQLGTALKFATDRGLTAIVEILLEAGANPDLADQYNVTPLLMACQRNAFKIAKHLILYNCCLETIGHLKVRPTQPALTLTPFRCSLHFGNAALAVLLVCAGCDLTQETYLWTSEDIPSLLVMDPDLFMWLQEVIHTPQTLRFMCRGLIRRSIKHPFPKNLSLLNLPKLLENVLLMTDVLGKEEQTLVEKARLQNSRAEE